MIHFYEGIPNELKPVIMKMWVDGAAHVGEVSRIRQPKARVSQRVLSDFAETIRDVRRKMKYYEVI